MHPRIRPALPADAPRLRALLAAAFPDEDLAPVVEALRADPAAEAVELVAGDEEPVGHVLFSRVTVEGADDLRASILAPLCAAPGSRGEGVGTALVEAGLEHLRARGDALCLVLGDPAYYGRFGFDAAAAGDLAPPHPLPSAYEGAWQARWLAPPRTVRGTVRPAAALAPRELWVE
jgi:putative acetyltransferase